MTIAQCFDPLTDENNVAIHNNRQYSNHTSNNGISIERLNEVSDINHDLKVTSDFIDHQQLPPTPPATPPNYGSEEILSENTKSENPKVLDNVSIRKRGNNGTLIAKPDINEACDSINSTYSHFSPSHLQQKSEKVSSNDLKQSNTASNNKSRKCSRFKKDPSEKVSETPISHQCQDCSKVFRTKSNLNQHRNIVHQNIRHTCEKCGKSFTHSGYRYHKLTAHRTEDLEALSSDDGSKSSIEEKIKKFECGKCGKRFAQNSLLRKHVSAVHEQTNDKNGGVRKFQCPYCPSQFKRKDHVDRHITHLHSIVPDAKLFECNHPNCGKRFQSAGRLQQHSKLHQDNSTHPCPICGKTILRKKNLSIHMITCHPTESLRLEQEKTPENTKIDTNIENNLENGSKYGKHSSEHITYSSNQTQKVPMKCLACDFTFIYPSKLAAHLSSYPDHCLIPSSYKKSENSKMKPKMISGGTEASHPEDESGISEKDLIVIDDFINALLSSKLN